MLLFRHIYVIIPEKEGDCLNSGEKIKQLRLDRGLTLEEVGKLVGVGKSTVRKWETGAIANMRRDKIAKLADALGVNPMDIINLYDLPTEGAPSASSPTLELNDKEANLIRDYRDASDEIRSAAATMLHTSAETNRRSGSATA